MGEDKVNEDANIEFGMGCITAMDRCFFILNVGTL